MRKPLAYLKSITNKIPSKLCLVILIVALGVLLTGLWTLLIKPKLSQPNQSSDSLGAQEQTLADYDKHADAATFVSELTVRSGNFKPSSEKFQARALKGYRFKVPIHQSKVSSVVLDDVKSDDVDLIQEDIVSKLKAKGFTYTEFPQNIPSDISYSPYYINKDYICEIIAIKNSPFSDISDPRLKSEELDTGPLINVACASIADYVDSAEFYKPIYESIWKDGSFQYYEVLMMGNKPIEGGARGYLRLEAARLDLLDVNLGTKYGVDNRAWFYKTPRHTSWQLLKDSVFHYPSCKSIEANPEIKKAFSGQTCNFIEKENDNGNTLGKRVIS